MKMWDGRFGKPSDAEMEKINNSLNVDKKLIEEDIAGSIAWAKALYGCGVVSKAEFQSIVEGLKEIVKDQKEGRVSFLSSDEDIHMAVERLLVEKIGAAGAKLHSGRSRNDQVVTDVRLYLKKAYEALCGAVSGLQEVLLKRSETDLHIIMPGYTHLQQAQPVLISHYWLSFFFALEREKTRLKNASALADVMPLGSGAVAGTGFAIDREALAADLGFARVSPNSIDGVASRDFILDALSCCASCAILFSRYAEDLIIWSSREFGFIELDDAWSTGSSMMPQKKNPDSLELIRSKAGRCIGNLTGFAATLKGVGLSYYKDLQADKEALFDSLDQLMQTCLVFTRVIETLAVKNDAVKRALDPFLLATDVADYLVGKNMPFRQAHKIVGKIVAYCIDKNVNLQALTPAALREFSDLFGPDVVDVFKWENAIAHRNVRGGTGLDSVRNQMAEARALISPDQSR
jgi:argininosuccinate lyase